MMNSGVFGWLSVVVSERRVGICGIGAFICAVPWCSGSIMGGFALALPLGATFSSATWEILAMSLVTVVGVCALRAWWGTY